MSNTVTYVSVPDFATKHTFIGPVTWEVDEGGNLILWNGENQIAEFAAGNWAHIIKREVDEQTAITHGAVPETLKLQGLPEQRTTRN